MRKKVTNILIINLSITDFTVSLFYVINPPPLDFTIHYPGILGEVICKLWMTNLTYWIPTVGSVFSLFAITIERYLAICFPLVYKRKFTRRTAFIMILLAWLVPSLYLTVWSVFTSKVVNGVCDYLEYWPNETFRAVISMIHFVASYAAPLCFMLICYCHMIFVLWKSRKMHQNKMMARATRNIVKTMALCFIFFVICWSWAKLYFFLTNQGVFVPDYTSPLFYAGQHLSIINSIVNPIIYILQYDQFKQAVKEVIFKCKDTTKQPEDLQEQATKEITSVSKVVSA